MEIKIKVSEGWVKQLKWAGFTDEQIAKEAQDAAEFYILDLSHDVDIMDEIITDMNNQYNPIDID